MSSRDGRNGLSPARRRRQAGLGIVRSLVTTVVLVVLYYELPLDHVTNVPTTLAVGVGILAVVTVLQLRVISRSALPAVKAIEALATTIPLFLLLFASAYVVMADASPANFSTHPLTRTDALYFTVTVFATVGFGDITAASQSARLVVTVQMLLDLLALGLVVRAFVSAVQLARRQPAPDTRPERDGDARLRRAFEGHQGPWTRTARLRYPLASDGGRARSANRVSRDSSSSTRTSRRAIAAARPGRTASARSPPEAGPAKGRRCPPEYRWIMNSCQLR